ncbi:MAG: hypothetical protein A3F13_04020 [Gammaproteobacteria bacterium RIFCSPHIGHO2_12_FULL_40_19]|nr:MAG: hypothetical protein A3F13_04020 [Gammaproteobacteria bacterium RIFCSPHIGHO2_12_FULL_40_19]
MNKKLTVLVASSLALLGCATASFAGKTELSPFSDNLTLTLNGFPSDTIFNALYVDNNGVNISGPDFFNTDAPVLVVVSSTNKLENGDPSMTVQYPTLGGTETCTLNLMDGPYALHGLSYKDGSAPICPGITVSPITLTSQYNYSVTITDNV